MWTLPVSQGNSSLTEGFWPYLPRLHWAQLNAVISAKQRFQPPSILAGQFSQDV